MDHGQCLSPETLTDYLEGGLDPAMKAVTELHLLSCDTCRETLASFMRILAEDMGPDEAPFVQVASEQWAKTTVARKMSRRPTGTYKGWLLGLVAILILGIVSLQFVWNPAREATSGEAVVELLLSQQRPFEARLAGQPHLALVRTRGADEPSFSYGVLAGEMTRLAANSYQMGRFYLIQKDFDKAIPYLEMAAHEVGAEPQCRNDLGVAYLEAGGDTFPVKANEEFRQALQADPAFAPAAFNLAISYERMGLFPEAKSQLEKFLQLDSRSDWADEARTKLEGLTR